MAQFASLVMVTEDNHNKFYRMMELGDGRFKVEFGRVDATPQVKTYPMSQWNSKYKSKIKKGYKDITDLVATDINEVDSEKKETMFISSDKAVSKLIEELQTFAKGLIAKNYKISSDKVTPMMVERAQELINDLVDSYKRGMNREEFNEILIKLYTSIPRKMKNVKDHLVKDNGNKEAFEAIIDHEQKLLDAMEGQVIANEKTEKKEEKQDTSDNTSLLEKLGLEITLVTDEDTISYVKRLMGEKANLFSKLFAVKNLNTESAYNEYFNSHESSFEEILWHGSRNQNWFNILQTGLMIRPSGVITNGSMFGNAIYFANKAQKSIGYSSLQGSYWTNGNENKSFLALFKVNVGKQKNVMEHTSECYKFSEKTIAPFDSVYAHAGKSLRNDELMIYTPKRCTIQYLIEITS